MRREEEKSGKTRRGRDEKRGDQRREHAPVSGSVSSGCVDPSLSESLLWIVRRAAKSIRRGVLRARAREAANPAAFRALREDMGRSARSNRPSWLLLLLEFD